MEDSRGMSEDVSIEVMTGPCFLLATTSEKSLVGLGGEPQIEGGCEERSREGDLLEILPGRTVSLEEGSEEVPGSPPRL